MITIKQIDAGTVSPKDDALLYDMLVGNSGIISGCTVTHLGANQLRIAAGRGIVHGRCIEVEAETLLAQTSPTGKIKGRLIIQLDIGNALLHATFVTQAAATLPALVQEDINASGNVYQLPLVTYDIDETQVSNIKGVAPIVVPPVKQLKNYTLKSDFDAHEHTAADVGADPTGSAATALTSAKTYAATEDAKVMVQLNNLATVATHTKSGIMHKLTLSATATEGLQQVAFMATAEYNEGDTWGVNGIAYTAEVAGEDGALPELLFVAGNIVSLTLDPNGKKLGFKSGGKPRVPDDFGDGSDGDLYIAAGETVVLPVLVPHQSIVVKQYKSVFIGVGATLKCSDPNAGLVIRCKGTFTCHGTIDQSLMSPKTNPSSTYQYPIELLCGSGGNGGSSSAYDGTRGNAGGTAMQGRPCGGGYGAGGAGGSVGSNSAQGGAGGSSNNITVDIARIFIGGASKKDGGTAGQGVHGGGGGGCSGQGANSTNYFGYAGGTGAGSNGGAGAYGSGAQAGGGGAGNTGGGVVLLYVAGALVIEGGILCTGATGGAGGYTSSGGAGAGGGGGGGGGAIYIMYNTTISNTAELNVNGGGAGSGGAGGVYGGPAGGAGQAGTIGTVTIKQYVKGMTV